MTVPMLQSFADRLRPTNRSPRSGVAGVELLEARSFLSATFFVAPDGDDANPGTQGQPWRQVQKAFDTATPGSTVNVLAGTYKEKLELNVSGNATDGFITFQAQAGAVISGRGVRGGAGGSNLIVMRDKDYVRIIGFELVDNLKVRDGSGIRIESSGDHIELLNNTIHRVTGSDAMGITVYGTSPDDGITNLVIDGNEIYDCRPAQSEALTLNGNVSDFRVTNNSVHDVNNIGIDLIGGEEGMCPDREKNAARHGVVAGNRVERARSKYGGGYAAGIYVDGGRDIVLENNVVSNSNLGIEVGCENPAGPVSSGEVTGVVVRNNVLFSNDKAGLGFGGYAPDRGRVIGCVFRNNTLYRNDAKNAGNGEIWIQWGSDNVVENNVASSLPSRPLVNFVGEGTGNRVDHNVFATKSGPARAVFGWGGEEYEGLDDFTAATGQDAHSRYADPQFVDPRRGNFHLADTSPAIDAGNPAFVPADDERDLDGSTRLLGDVVDAGADEVR